ncbi:hypothetical protein EW146_g2962 [Bondarzewia mesenterica]|uniref:non-specific serine/threonine protein kinase n=1 Tax=Bondarzewia mesenterica TaxID=1095465 RepID=A0A4S4M510_9AGAM|nr:hypothetical protein EW146_g2962 [Bondarzewia mesenterica]
MSLDSSSSFSPDDIRDLTGNIIDNLTLDERIATGSFGVVYRAFDSSSPTKEFAIKCLPKSNSLLRCLIENEIDMLNRVAGHPNIATVHKIIDDKNFVFIVMDYFPFGDLRHAIQTRCISFRDDELVKDFVDQILDAVEWCHKKTVFHRDLKPCNFLYSKDDKKICLTDFGLSSRNEYSRSRHCGTKPFMSPECYSLDGGYSPRCNDIWSLGIILIALITGSCPWSSPDFEGDDNYKEFLSDEEFLRKNLPISKEANDLLRRILDPCPSSRITLQDLRAEIASIETFFHDGRGT